MTDHTPTPDTMCTCGHGAASAHDIDNSVSAFTACVVSGCTCKAFTLAPEAATRAVQGHCPACGGSSLFLGDGGYVTCSRIDCPVPDAASTLLETDPRTTPEAPATNPCRATYETPTARTIRQATEEAESAKACERETFADLAAERAAHEEHRRQLADALGLIDPRAWADMIDQVGVIRTAATERAAALRDAREALGAAGHGPDSDDWAAIAPAIVALAADVKLQRGNSEVDRREASRRRETLAGALGLDTGAGWDAITDRAREVAADLAGDAPWIRAHREDLEDAKLRAKKAEEGERRAMRQRQEMAEERYALQQRADLADRVKRTAAKDAAYALKRAEKAEAAIARVRDLADRLADGTEAGFRAALDVRAALDGEQPGRAKRSVTCGEPGWAEQERARMERLYTTAYFRAERLEKQLVAVRKAVADAKACGGEDAGCTVDHRDIITAIIDGEQPPATPAPAAISLPLIAPCARCHAATARCDTKGRFLCQRCDSIEQASGEHAGEPEPDDAELTADEARALADDLALQLYRADDALAFVAEMCDIADREETPVTTTRVRDWLKGAQCARQAGPVLTRRR